MLASNYSKNLNINLNNNNNNKLINANNEKLSAFTPTASSTSSSLDYLYQAITLIEETKTNHTSNSTNNSTTTTASTSSLNDMSHAKKSDEPQSPLNNKFNSNVPHINKSNGCTNPCCNCRSLEALNRSKTRKRSNESDTGGGTPLKLAKQLREDRKSDRQATSSNKYKKIKTYDANYPDFNNNNNNSSLIMNGTTSGLSSANIKPSVVPSRLEKAKQFARKTDLRLNISSEPLTPISASSLSPQSVKSVISPSDSPFINSQPASAQPTAFNYYPIEVISNLLPFYFSPFTANSAGPFAQQQQQPSTSAQSTTPVSPLPPPMPPQSHTLLNNDPNYLQNLINSIYSLAYYQQMQQLINPLNSNNLILYSIQQQLQQQQQQQQQRNTLNISNPIQSPPQQQPVIIKKQPSEPFVKSKLISYINKSDIENKVNEHFRRSLGSKYLKISNKLNKSTLNKPKTRTLSDSCDATTNSSNSTNRLVNGEESSPSLNYSNDLNYDVDDDDDETFIEYTNDEQQASPPLSPVSTVSASDSYSRASINDDDLVQNEILDEDEVQEEQDKEEEEDVVTSAATNNTLLFSPVSSNSIAEVNY